MTPREKILRDALENIKRGWNPEANRILYAADMETLASTAIEQADKIKDGTALKRKSTIKKVEVVMDKLGKIEILLSGEVLAVDIKHDPVIAADEFSEKDREWIDGVIKNCEKSLIEIENRKDEGPYIGNPVETIQEILKLTSKLK